MPSLILGTLQLEIEDYVANGTHSYHENDLEGGRGERK